MYCTNTLVMSSGRTTPYIILVPSVNGIICPLGTFIGTTFTLARNQHETSCDARGCWVLQYRWCWVDSACLAEIFQLTFFELLQLLSHLLWRRSCHNLDFPSIFFLTLWCSCCLSGAIAPRSQTSALVSLGSKCLVVYSKVYMIFMELHALLSLL